MRSLGYAVLLTAAFSVNAFAYHAGGVAECNGCHTMHGSFEGEAVAPRNQLLSPGPWLLKGSDQSSTCLNCHGGNDTAPTSYHVKDTSVGVGNAPANMGPGGDFGWLAIDYVWAPRNNVRETSYGERRGHNVVAADFGMAADSVVTTAPGGTYPADALHCSSCHDPHGRYRRLSDGSIVRPAAGEASLPIRSSGSYNNSPNPTENVYAVGVYRLLAGDGYLPKSVEGQAGLAFSAAPPAAVAPSTYNRSESVQQTRVAYGSGMSEWCANCHTAMLQLTYTSGVEDQKHPAGNDVKLPAFIRENYNKYVKTGTFNGTDTTSYSSLVPFEEGTANYNDLKAHAKIDGTYLNGPTATANVMCLTCHRAHASAFDSSLRWSMAYEFMTDGDASGVPSYGFNIAEVQGTSNAYRQGRTQAESESAYYGRPATVFAPYQRVLCNKCHLKD